MFLPRQDVFILTFIVQTFLISVPQAGGDGSSIPGFREFGNLSASHHKNIQIITVQIIL